MHAPQPMPLTKKVRLAALLQKLSLTKVNWPLAGLIVAGVAALVYYLAWWFRPDRLTSLWLLPGLIAMLVFVAFQILSHWTIYLLADFRPRRIRRATTHYTVDVFVTACGEDPLLIRRCLAAACAMRGQPRVWLLDDGRDPELARMAADLDAGYLTRPDRTDAKAGNLNHALAHTDGEIVAVFDVDHAPVPGYLEATLHHFDDPGVGFVQVMLTFHEHERQWVEQAAAESSFTFYNPTSTGMDTLGSATMMGSNSLIRRSALAAIGNYQTGLAEDLATSLALHRRGWRSAYVAEPLAPGLAPPDLPAWFTQQFKWARGVFEVLVTTAPAAWRDLTWGDRLAYAVRLTMYWLGPAIFVHLLATLVVLLAGSPAATTAYANYLLHLAPLVFVNVLVHGQALKRWLHPSLRPRAMGQAVVLVFATWPVYTLAWGMALLRIPLAFRPTPKRASGQIAPAWLVPQAGAAVALAIAAGYRLARPDGAAGLLVAGAAVALALPHLLFFGLLARQPADTGQPGLVVLDDLAQGE